MLMKEFKFLIVLFKNNSKRKIINKFMTFERAKSYYNNLIVESEKTIFPEGYSNGKKIDYELAIISSEKKLEEVKFLKDQFGRQIKLELEDNNFKIIEIKPYKIEESFVDSKTKKKIDTKKFIEKYLKTTDIKLISKLNNKIILQNDDKINLFVLKNMDDADRFIDSLNNHLVKNKRFDCILVKDVSHTQRKFLYDLLSAEGYSKSYLLRQSTTHPTKK